MGGSRQHRGSQLCQTTTLKITIYKLLTPNQIWVAHQSLFKTCMLPKSLKQPEQALPQISSDKESKKVKIDKSQMPNSLIRMEQIQNYKRNRSTV